jgi:hypothetical protein
MNDNIGNSEKTSTRRDLLKKAGKFVIPTIFTFQLSSMMVQASGALDFPKGNPLE